jgi:hypothetical protein
MTWSRPRRPLREFHRYPRLIREMKDEVRSHMSPATRRLLALTSREEAALAPPLNENEDEFSLLCDLIRDTDPERHAEFVHRLFRPLLPQPKQIKKPVIHALITHRPAQYFAFEATDENFCGICCVPLLAQLPRRYWANLRFVFRRYRRRAGIHPYHILRPLLPPALLKDLSDDHVFS